MLPGKGQAFFPAGKGKQWRLFAGVGNLTNERYASMIVVNALAPANGEPRYFYPGMPRNLYGGLTLSF